MWRDDLIQGDMLKQTGLTERYTKERNIYLTPPPQLYSNVERKLFLHEHYDTFDILLVFI